MLFHNYLEGILGSKVKVKLVRALLKNPNRVYSGRELARQIQEISHMAVFKSLKDLVAFNLVKLEYHGGIQLIRINKKSYLYKPLKSIFYYESITRNKLIKLIKKTFSKYKEIEAIILFGSISRGNESIDSDIDLLIITKDKDKISDIVADYQKKITEKFGNVMSATIMTGEEYEKKQNLRLIKYIKKEGILVLGKI